MFVIILVETFSSFASLKFCKWKQQKIAKNEWVILSKFALNCLLAYKHMYTIYIPQILIQLWFETTTIDWIGANVNAMDPIEKHAHITVIQANRGAVYGISFPGIFNKIYNVSSYTYFYHDTISYLHQEIRNKHKEYYAKCISIYRWKLRNCMRFSMREHCFQNFVAKKTSLSYWNIRMERMAEAQSSMPIFWDYSCQTLPLFFDNWITLGNEFIGKDKWYYSNQNHV